ncbi:MAG: prepilin-type N-terminal cleavage/methylation domain-containing protein [Gemmatimonadales bacterium]
MTLRGRRGCMLFAMQPRRAFTLVEVLVALVLMGVAAAGMVTALSGDHRLREAAAVRTFAAGRARERLELLATLPCSGDSSGASPSRWGVEYWRAQASPTGWRLTDSIVPAASAGSGSAAVVIQARIACAG